MDSKYGLPTSHEEEAALPPSYNETVTPGTAPKLDPPKYIPTGTTAQIFSHQIQDQLHSITSQINSLQTQKVLLSNAKDEKILSLLTTQIQHFLAQFAQAGLQKGRLVLVPDNGIEDKKAMPTTYDLKKTDEYDRVIRIVDKEGDGFGQEETWYWRDRAMARRLAGYLTPAPDPYTAELPARKEEITPSSGRGLWGRITSGSKSQVQPVAKPGPIPSESSAEKISMDVKAEEIVFRTEDAYGILGTESGWAIILTLKVVLAQ